MFDVDDRPSAFEAELRRVVDSWIAGKPISRASHADQVVFDVDHPPHARRRAAGAVDEAPPLVAAAGLSALGQVVDAGAVHLAVVREQHRASARAAALQARAVAAFARSRPATLDRPDAEVGAAAAATRAARPSALAAVSEWAVDEIAVALSVTGAAATVLLTDSLLLVECLPATLAALEDGRISLRHAQVLTDLVAPMPEGLRGVAEQRLLQRVDGKTPAQLRAAAHRVVARLDPEAVARRVTNAIRDRRVAVHPGADGMATLAATLTTPVARACQRVLEELAAICAGPGDDRTKDQRMSDCLVDLILRAGSSDLPPVQAQLTVIAFVETLLGGDEPGEVCGDLVPAETIRQLARTLGLLPQPVVDASPAPAVPWAEPVPEPEPAVCDAAPPPVADTGAERRRALGELLARRQITGTTLASRVPIALVDELSGQLLALTDAAGIRQHSWCHAPTCAPGTCTHDLTGRPGLGPPPDSPGYRPARELDRFIRLRYRLCRFPGCRAPATICDLDHGIPWPGGTTSHCNLACLCRHHHRLSHQAPGWSLQTTSHGGLRWTTPTGQVITTHPPGHGTDGDPPTPAPGPPDTEQPDDDPPF